jgi:hypothetical protein
MITFVHCTKRYYTGSLYASNFILIMVCSSKLTFLRLSRWTKVKGLYIITRYIPFLVLIMDIYRAFSSSTHPADYELTCCLQCTSRRTKPPMCVNVKACPTDECLLSPAYLHQRCRMVISIYACTWTAHAACTFLLNADLSSHRFNRHITPLL